MFQVLRGAYVLLRVLAVTESQETLGLLDEIQQQLGVFVLSGPAVAITNVVPAREFLAQPKFRDSMKVKIPQKSNIQKMIRTTKQKSHYPTHCKTARIHENMEHPSNRTLVWELRLGGVKRRFILAAAKHSCGACEAQKRPAGLNREPFT